MSVLHLGTKDFEALAELLPSGVQAFRDGDSWEEWGEPVLPDRAEHIVINGGYSGDLLNDVSYILQESPGLLEPMIGPDYQRGTIAAITDEHDWSESILVLTNSHARRSLAS